MATSLEKKQTEWTKKTVSHFGAQNAINFLKRLSIVTLGNVDYFTERLWFWVNQSGVEFSAVKLKMYVFESITSKFGSIVYTSVHWDSFA